MELYRLRFLVSYLGKIYTTGYSFSNKKKGKQQQNNSLLKTKNNISSQNSNQEKKNILYIQNSMDL